MINEKTTDLLVERLIRRMEKANTYFLTKIGSSIKQIRDLSPSQAQQLAQILKYGGNYEKIIKEMSKYTEMNVEDIEDIFSNYAKKDQNFYKQFYQYKDIPYTPFDENLALKTQTMALSNIAKNEMYNFSRTNVLGYTINDEFYGLRETYNKLLDTAMLNIGQGKETFDMAMKRIMEDIGGSGIKTLNYESGRNVRLDSAIRMHLKSRLRELHNENQLLIGDEIEADGVEVSVHANPADDHAEIQGRQFSLEEWEKLQAGEVAQDYNGKEVQIKHSKHGGYRPISEMNCYHYIFSIVLGASEPEYTEEQLEEIQQENETGFDFDEKHYTNYEGTQLQRALERKVREQKDIQILAKASGNEQLISQAQKKITQLTQKYRELVQKSGLSTRMDRMRVTGYRRTKVKNNINMTKNIVSKEKTIDFGKYRDVIDNTKSLTNLGDNFRYNEFMKDYNKLYNSLDKKEVQKVYNDFVNYNRKDEKQSHPIGKYLNKKLGYDAKPELIDEKDFWIDEDGESVLKYHDATLLDKNHWYRGVEAEGVENLRERTKKYIEDFKNGEYYAGIGINGNGTYATESYSYAERYAPDEYGIMYIMPKENAKIVSIDKVNAIRQKLIPYISEKDDIYSNFSTSVLMDTGYLAEILGYDIVDLGTHKLILNRGAIKVVK